MFIVDTCVETYVCVCAVQRRSSLHKHTTSLLLFLKECGVPGLAALRHHLVQLWQSVPVALLRISHGVLAGQQLTRLHTAPTTHTHIQKTDKTVMSLCLTGHNSRTGLAAHCGL